MTKSYLHIRDALAGTSPGMLIASRETRALKESLARLLGKRMAERILQHAGRPGVLHMNAAELVATAGVPLRLAERLVAARHLFEACHPPALPRVQTPHDGVCALPQGLGSLETEVLLALALNNQMRLVATILVARGGPSGAAVTPSDMFVPLVRLGAKHFVLVHNHPSGDPTPSTDDVTMTNAVSRLGNQLGVRLADHLIVAGARTFSFHEAGLLHDTATLKHAEVPHG